MVVRLGIEAEESGNEIPAIGTIKAPVDHPSCFWIRCLKTTDLTH